MCVCVYVCWTVQTEGTGWVGGASDLDDPALWPRAKRGASDRAALWGYYHLASPSICLPTTAAAASLLLSIREICTNSHHHHASVRPHHTRVKNYLQRILTVCFNLRQAQDGMSLPHCDLEKGQVSGLFKFMGNKNPQITPKHYYRCWNATVATVLLNCYTETLREIYPHSRPTAYLGATLIHFSQRQMRWLTPYIYIWAIARR